MDDEYKEQNENEQSIREKTIEIGEEKVYIASLFDELINPNIENLENLLNCICEYTTDNNEFDIGYNQAEKIHILIKLLKNSDSPIFELSLITLTNILRNMINHQLPIDIFHKPKIIEKLFHVFINCQNHDVIRIIYDYLYLFNRTAIENRDLVMNIFDLDQILTKSEEFDNDTLVYLYKYFISLLYFPINDRFLFYFIRIASSDVMFLNSSAFSALLDLITEISKQNINVIIESPAFMQIMMTMEVYSNELADKIMDFFEIICESDSFYFIPPSIFIKFLRSDDQNQRAANLICKFLENKEENLPIFIEYGIFSAIYDGLTCGIYIKKFSSFRVLLSCLKIHHEMFLINLLTKYDFTLIDLLIEAVDDDSKELTEICLECLFIIFSCPLPEEIFENSRNRILANDGVDLLANLELDEIDEQISSQINSFLSLFQES